MLKKIISLSVVFLFVTGIIKAQEEQLEEHDYIHFVSVFAGLNSTKYQSSDILENSEFGTGFNIGINYTYFPDYEWQSYLLRVGLEYTREQTEDNIPRQVLREDVTVKGEFDNIGLNLFAAYRFDKDAKIDAYLGGGGRFQYLFNANDSYQFIREDGSTFPVFNSGLENIPYKYRTDAASFSFGLILETGAYFKIGGEFAHVSIGFITSKYLKDNTANFNITKSTWYAKLAYQIF